MNPCGPRLAIVSDYLEEDWPSMERTANMLTQSLQCRAESAWGAVDQIRPPMKLRFSRASFLPAPRLAFNADRLCARMLDYPLYMRGLRGKFDVFHIADHSYAHLVHALPRARTGVYCHDLDTFRCLIEPDRAPRPPWFRSMTRLIESGFRRAAVVFHNSRAVGLELERHGLVDADRLVYAPLGVGDAFRPLRPGEKDVAVSERVAGLPAGYLLHVGSCIPRKRIDVLLAVFAGLRTMWPELVLVKASGEWSEAQRRLIQGLDLERSIVHLTRLSEDELVALYRRAAATLVTSEAEGFCLPLIESLACGGVVFASDLGVLREVGGDAVVFCGAGDVPDWIARIASVLRNPAEAPPLDLRLQQARKYSWSSHSEIISGVYQKLINDANGASRGHPHTA